MRVVQFLASKEWGGIENIFVSLCNELSQNINIEVIVFDNHSITDNLVKEITVHRLSSNSNRLNPLLYLEINSILKRVQPDIVHTHGAKATEIFYRINKILKIPHVATKQNSRKGYIFNRIKYVTAASEGIKNSIKKESVKIIYNGIKLLNFKPLDKNNIFTILVVGRLEKIKGFDILIQECTKLDFEFKLNIIGEGEERKNLEKIIKELKLENRIELLGYRTDIPELMNQADLVVMSSHSEGFSIVMIEAFFYANLFISTRVSGATEMLTDEFLIDNFDIAKKINEIYKNYNYYKKSFLNLALNNQKKILLSEVTKEYIMYYNEIMKHEN